MQNTQLVIAGVDFARPTVLRRTGIALLVAGFLVCNLAVLFLAAVEPLLIVAIPALVVVSIILFRLFSRPALNLIVLLGSFAFIARFEEGIQIVEVFFALYLLSFLAIWLLDRQFGTHRSLFTQLEDRLLAIFLVWMTASFGLTLLLDGRIPGAVSEWSALLMLALYFPVKEIVATSERGPRLILAVVLWLAAFAAIRNLLYMREALASATQLWQVVHGRVPLNEVLPLAGSLACLVLMIYARHWHTTVLSLLGTAVFVGTLILTQSRAYWIDFAFGLILLVLVLERTERRRLLTLLSWAFAVSLVLGVALFGDLVWTLAVGIFDRFISIFTAAETDISVINRFFETQAVWRKIVANPIMGYGLGVDYRFFDIIDQVTYVRAYTHNGLLSLWYKFGFFGLLGLVVFWARTARNGLKAFRSDQLSASSRTCGLIAFLGLATFLPSVVTSNPFFLSDTLIVFGIMAGWASGVRARDLSLSTAPAPVGSWREGWGRDREKPRM